MPYTAVVSVTGTEVRGTLRGMIEANQLNSCVEQKPCQEKDELFRSHLKALFKWFLAGKLRYV